MPITPSRKLWFALVLSMLVVAVFLLVTNLSHEPSADNLKTPTETKAQIQAESPPGHPKKNPRPSAKTEKEEPGSVEELALFVKSAGKTKSADQVFAYIAKMGWMQSLWWSGSTDFSELLTLSLDSTLTEDTRLVALRLFLAGVPIEALREQADSLQDSFSDSSDRLVSALLQDMADRNVAPKSLIRSTLADPSRGEHAQCMAWYAARLTDTADLELASVALDQTEKGVSIVSKVALDYLAVGDLSEQINSTPSLRHKVDKQLEAVMNLPPSAEIIEMANADAFIMAIPSLIDSERSKQVLLETLHNAPNPEIRLSALEQIVRRQNSEQKDMTKEVDAILKNLQSLFPDQAKQIRATAILNRTLLSSTPETK